MRKGSNKLKLLIEMIAVFQSKIKRLPGYLAIQFVRFYYKEKEAINAKILKVQILYKKKFLLLGHIFDLHAHIYGILSFLLYWQDVKFTMSLDVYDLCTPGLQAKLQPARDKFKEQEDKKAEEMIQVKQTYQKSYHCYVLLIFVFK